MQEAARQNIPNLADLKTDAIVSQEVRSSAERIAVDSTSDAGRTTLDSALSIPVSLSCWGRRHSDNCAVAPL